MNHEQYRSFYRFVSVWNDILAFLVTVGTTLVFMAGCMIEMFLIYPVGRGYLLFILLGIAGLFLLIGSIAVFLYAGAILWDPADEEPKKYLFFEILASLMFVILLLFLIAFDILISFQWWVNVLVILFPIAGMAMDAVAFDMKRRESEVLEKSAVKSQGQHRMQEDAREAMKLEAELEALDQKMQPMQKKYGVRGLIGEYAGVEIEFQPEEYVVFGKSPEQSQVIFTDRRVSRFHICLCYHKETKEYQVTDYSTNGTYTSDGNRLIKGVGTSFHSGETIRFGDTQIFQFM